MLGEMMGLEKTGLGCSAELPPPLGTTKSRGDICVSQGLPAIGTGPQIVEFVESDRSIRDRSARKRRRIVAGVAS